MKLILMVISFLCMSSLFSQNSVEYKYYKNVRCTRETKKEKAKFIVIQKQINDSIKKVELKEAENHNLIWTRQFNNDEPFGTWCSYDSEGNLTSKIVYGRYKYEGYRSFDLETNNLKVEDKGHFEPPLFKGKNVYYSFNSENLGRWIATNIHYPVEAQNKGIQGNVFVQFEIDKKGLIGNIRITRSVHELLDLEVYKLIQKLPQLKPGRLNDENISLYVEAPVTFELR